MQSADEQADWTDFFTGEIIAAMANRANTYLLPVQSGGKDGQANWTHLWVNFWISHRWNHTSYYSRLETVLKPVPCKHSVEASQLMYLNCYGRVINRIEETYTSCAILEPGRASQLMYLFLQSNTIHGILPKEKIYEILCSLGSGCANPITSVRVITRLVYSSGKDTCNR